MKTIELTKGKFAIVDDDMFKELNQYKWQSQKGGNNYYACRYTKKENGNRRKNMDAQTDT